MDGNSILIPLIGFCGCTTWAMWLGVTYVLPSGDDFYFPFKNQIEFLCTKEFESHLQRKERWWMDENGPFFWHHPRDSKGWFAIFTRRLHAKKLLFLSKRIFMYRKFYDPLASFSLRILQLWWRMMFETKMDQRADNKSTFINRNHKEVRGSLATFTDS